MSKNKTPEPKAAEATHSDHADHGGTPHDDNAADKAVTTAEAQPAEETNAEGMKTRRVIMNKMFLPDDDFIMKEVVGRGKGTKCVMGRVFGLCTAVEVKTSEYQGKQLQSIALKGMFQYEGYMTGELGTGTTYYPPGAYAERVALVMKQEGTLTVEVDIDVGLEATGKTIPYEWTCTAWTESGQFDVLRRLRAVGQDRRRKAGKLPASKIPALPAPAEA